MSQPPVRPQLVHRATFDAVIEVSPDPVWIVDAGGFLVGCNAAFERWWRELTGRAAATGEVMNSAPPRIADLQRRALEGRAVSTDVRVIAGGVERAYVIYAQPAAASGGAAFTARVASRGAQAVSETSLELALTHLFDSTDPIPELCARALEFLCTTDGWDAAVLWQRHGDVLRATATWFASDAARERLAPRFDALRFPIGHGLAGRAWAAREVVWIADLLDETSIDRGEIAAAAGLRSAIAAPLIESGRLGGVLELFTHTDRPLDERMRKALAHTGTALARLIERRRLIDQIERKGAEWMQTFDSIALPILLIAMDGRIARLNAAARALTGGDYDAVVGRRLLDLGEHEPWKTLADTVAAVADASMECTAQITTDAGTWNVTASPLSARDGDDGRVIVAMHDISEMIRLQDSVRRGEQLAALGELVAGVAHELRNPLFGLGATLEVIEQTLAGNSDVAELIAPMRGWLVRLQSLADNLLEYGKTWTVSLAPGDVSAVLRQAVDAARGAVRLDDQTGGARILMDASRLVLVFENLVENAIQHSPEGRTVHVATRRDADVIEITVRDEGPGFTPADLPHVFQPFFTRRRGGTGLGLSIVQRIIDEHGGTVTAANAAQGGAVVAVRLPIYQSENGS